MKVKLKDLKKGKKKSVEKQVKESVKKRKQEAEQFIEKSIENKLNVIEDEQLPALEAVPISGNTIEYWITPLGRAKIQAWKRNGLSKGEIAMNMGISSATLYRWEKDFSLIREALSLGREELVLSAEHALVQKALGYESTERHHTIDNEGKEVIKTVTKHIPPDFSSLQFFLTNMKPDQWKARQTHEADVNVTGRFANLTDDELEKAMNKFQEIVSDVTNGEG